MSSHVILLNKMNGLQTIYEYELPWWVIEFFFIITLWKLSAELLSLCYLEIKYVYNKQ